MLRRCSSISLLLVFTFVIACTQSPRVKRGRVDKPETVDLGGRDSGKGNEGRTGADLSPSGDERGSGESPGEEVETGSGSEREDTGRTEERSEEAVVEPPLPKNPQEPRVYQRATATGRCETGDWGACFRVARRHLSEGADDQAVQVYKVACQPGSKYGDALACFSAALLSKSSEISVQSTESFLREACNKTSHPVMHACR